MDIYRDDVCAVCGESLPPDHIYCREHAATVDDRLHEIAALVPRVLDDLGRLATLLCQVADETWDYVAEQDPAEPEWPPVPHVTVHADGDAVNVDVGGEPGMVRVDLDVALPVLLRALVAGVDTDELRRMAARCAEVEGANATH
ncbi:MAG: hypothetical protein H0V93_01340 [Euzebyales bacterium]|nr:hypothetical protein [Euzebyales bacterium]